MFCLWRAEVAAETGDLATATTLVKSDPYKGCRPSGSVGQMPVHFVLPTQQELNIASAVLQQTIM